MEKEGELKEESDEIIDEKELVSDSAGEKVHEQIEPEKTEEEQKEHDDQLAEAAKAIMNGENEEAKTDPADITTSIAQDILNENKSEELDKLKEMQNTLDNEKKPDGSQDDVDARSIFVKNVDYAADPKELKEHFANCGTINRVTILCDPVTGHSFGYAYIEFAEVEGAKQGLVLNESLFKGRQLTVAQKRKNIPARGMGRGRYSRYPGYGGRMGGGMFRGGYRGFRHPYRGYRPY